MSSVEAARKLVRVRARNIGGIDETDVELSPGVNVLAGRNATNRTSLLQAIMAGLGSDRASLKGDADEGHVELTIGEQRYTRTLERTNGVVTTSGEPYLSDPELADLFSFLLESNEARRAVERGEDLYELIMRPVDTGEIQAEIEELETRKREIDDELEEVESRRRQLPDLEQRRTRLADQLEERRDELAAKRAELDALDTDVEQTRDEKSELDRKLDELRQAHTRLEDVEYGLETQRESIESLEEERESLTERVEALPDAPVGEVRELDAQIDRLRDHKQSLESTVSELQKVVQFNRNFLEGGRPELLAEIREQADDDGEALTEQLLSDSETVVCWTCGSEVEQQELAGTLDRLEEIRKSKLDERNELTAELDELKSRRDELQEKQRERDGIERKLESVVDELEERRENREALAEKRDRLTETVAGLETEVEALEETEYSEVLDLHREVNQLEFECERLEDDVESAEEELTAAEARVEAGEELNEERETIRSNLADLRTRIEQIQERAVEQFNDHMQSVLDILGYSNVERIWIERTERRVREGRRTVDRTVFDLHVIRSTASGATYEDTVEHLSESEREVTGLVFALAGYLVHDVHETVPFMVLDSLEAIDSDRIAALVDYLQEYAPYLVVALLPEDAAALDEDYRRVTEI